MSVYLQSWSKRFSTSYMQQRKTYSLNHGLVSCEKLTIHLFLDHSFSFNVKTDFTLNVKLVSQNLLNKLRKRMDGKKEGLINFDLLNGLNFNISSLQAQHQHNEANAKCQKLEFIKWPPKAGCRNESISIHYYFKMSMFTQKRRAYVKSGTKNILVLVCNY